MSTLAIWSPRPEAETYFQLSPQVVIYGLPIMQITPLLLSDKEKQHIFLADVFIFISQQAAKNFLKQTSAHYLKIKIIIAIGKKTANALGTYGLSPNIIAPSPFTSEALLSNKAFLNIPLKTFALIGGKGGRTLLQDELSNRGRKVYRIECYQRDKSDVTPKIMLEFIDNYNINAGLLSSCEMADMVADIFIPCARHDWWKLPMFVLSKRIATHTKQLGFTNTIVAKAACRETLHETILAWHLSQTKASH
ncbi:MAG: uroporphyrinogen-III synthase [Ostreibacterium sp.]